ncbi:MAG: D-alanine--D-alanine ligase, partial [Clostridia bacterium]|nr:D-alanine--D-alanine ligase [Clostridia bacterium]
MKKTVAIIFGGESSEYEVSCVSAANVAENLDTELYVPILVGITKDGKWWIFRGSTDDLRNHVWQEKRALLSPAIISPCKAHHGILALDGANGSFEIIRVDVVFPVLHGKNGEDGTMQGLLELAGLPYVGCDTYSSAVSMDKAATKTICVNAGIPVVPFISAVKTDNIDELIAKSEEKYGYPVFVKPANAGSSVGITKAKNKEELKNGIELAFNHDRKLLIEPNTIGREIEVAVCGNDKPFASVCGEIVSNSDFYDYETKYIDNRAECIAPALIDDSISDEIRKYAVMVYKALDCTGLSRVDFFLTEDGALLNEINTIPGFTPISMYPKMMNCIGIGYGELITKLLSL